MKKTKEELDHTMEIFRETMDFIGATCYGSIYRKKVKITERSELIFEFIVDHYELLEVKWQDDHGNSGQDEERIDGTVQLLGFLNSIHPLLAKK